MGHVPRLATRSRGRARTLLDTLAPPALPDGTSAPFTFETLDVEQGAARITTVPAQPLNLYRHYVAARRALEPRPDDRVEILGGLLAGLPAPVTAARVFQMADLLEIAGLVPAARRYARAPDDGLGLVWATSILARLGGAQDLEFLERRADDRPVRPGSLAEAVRRTTARGVERIRAGR